MTTTVIYVQPTAEVGGSDIALFRLVSSLDRDRWRPVVVLPRAGPILPKFQEAGVAVHLNNMMQLRPRFDIPYQARYAASFWPSAARLARIITREHAQIVHTNSLFSLHGPSAAKLARMPNVWHIRELPDAPGPAIRAAAIVAVTLSERVIAASNGVARLFNPKQRRDGKVVTIYDGIDVAKFDPSVPGGRIRQELGLDPTTPVVGFVGRLDPWKGCDVFVRAAAEVARRHPSARFLIGGGPLPGYEGHAASLHRLAAELGIREQVIFTGWKGLDDIPEVMAAIDVFVHTSIRPEPFGLVLVEAMATARPVVATMGGGVPEVVDDGVTGVLVPPGDWCAVAESVVGLLDDPKRARAMGLAGRRRAVRLFELSAYTRKVETLYESVLSLRR